ncbi:MAG: hypothetical protein JWP61_1353 [Friedmanniella sp.]|nr:hypothetical protein [Friedmanniella sp.]
MSTQIFVASTAFGLATVVAALEADLFEPAERRLLVLSNNATMPEASPSVAETPGFAALAARFDEVLDYNETIAPQHPSAWNPRSVDLPLWERAFRQRWRLGEAEVRLVLESIQVSPAQALSRIFAEAPIEVYADGLMSYGPTRNPMPDDVGARIERLLHLDLVPGLAPLLLSEWAVPTVLVPIPLFRSVVAELGPDRAPAYAEPVALVLGQYLSSAGLLTENEELELYETMLAAAAAGSSRVLFKPHPGAPAGQAAALVRRAAARGVGVELAPTSDLAETLYAREPVVLVLGCFSTGLLTAATAYGLPVACLGTELLLERLSPYQNSNRIPVTLVDALVPPLAPAAGVPVSGPGGDGAVLRQVPALSALVVAVSYAMQPQLLAARRGEAVAFLEQHPGDRGRYVKRRRLTRLDLPGRPPARTATRSGWRVGARRLLRSIAAVR